MRVLNLTSLANSDIKYKISKFPDGQQNIVIDKRSFYDISEFRSNYPNNQVTIKSRLNNWLDLELIVASVASLKELGVEEIHLYTPYIVGARSDRKFEEGGNNYLKDVICPVINSMNFKSVTCIDPHSDILEACIKNFKKESNKNLVGFAAVDIYGKRPATEYLNKNAILVSPDAGASKKIYKLAEQIGYKGDIITCSKERDTEGKLTKTVVPIIETFPASSKDYIIIDDICDGGRTFINIAKELKSSLNKMNGKFKGKIYLIVTHGIFSNGFYELSQYFDGIYCTNSYSDWSDSQKDGSYSYLKQLNVF